MEFFEFNQNNSGGSFITDSNLCHRLFIEANDANEANTIAENLGCYWDGCESGNDCSCCGDRWYTCDSPVDISAYLKNGYPTRIYITTKSIKQAKELALNHEKLINAAWVGELKIEPSGWSKNYYVVTASIKITDLESYAQFMADEYGWTSPDIRIYYKDGTVKEIFSAKVKK